MIDRETFDLIKRKHGGYASWAVWAESSGSRKDWLADPDILDPDRNSTLLAELKNDVVMLGLNQSGREIERPFGNFHDYNRHGHDYKIPFAFADTDYRGAYMTDLIKVPELESGNLARRLRADPSLVEASLSKLREELDDLGGPPPTLIAFGGLTYRLARRHADASWYSTLRRVTHYSAWQFTAEEYRGRVRAELGL